MVELLSLVVLFYPVVILALVFIDFVILHLTKQPITAYIFTILGIIYTINGINLYFNESPIFAIPGIAILMFGIMQTLYGVYTIRQYQKRPEWQSL